jgi:hypothetical protein
MKLLRLINDWLDKILMVLSRVLSPGGPAKNHKCVWHLALLARKIVQNYTPVYWF